MTDDTEIHLQVIRQALNRGNAAVMVGSGFSLNAINGNVLKGWGALAQGLYGELHPGQKAPILGTSDMLRLAEEYRQTFSRSKLDTFLREQLPDERVTPGSLHKDLLKLSWSEIFTTNYDTLIERAAELDIETPHYTVMCREDIPESRIARRRRIVKLHGSFPSQRPFIFTEEDYRLYPTKFAPFVNLVRQSLLENVFCLIGFSGDDPNFLNWIGWVRDMLEAHTLPIYLFLDTEPSYGQLRLLQSRHITPVVLPKPALIENPSFADRYVELFSRLKAVSDDSSRVWPRYVRPPSYDIQNGADKDAELKFYIELLPTWQKTRADYPGWLIAPEAARRRLYSQDDGYPASGLGSSEIRQQLGEQPVVALILLAEFAWRQRIGLLPLWDDVAVSASAALLATEKYLDVGATWPTQELPDSWGLITVPRLSQAWFDVALAYLHWARQQMSMDLIDTWTEKLNKRAANLPPVKDAVIGETIQCLLLKGDRQAALAMLTTWIPDPVEPYNGILRAAWLAECDIDSREAAQEALGVIRKLARHEPNSNWILSREAWACQTAYRIEKSFDIQWRSPENERDATADLVERLRNLSVREHDPERELDKLSEAVNTEVHPSIGMHIKTIDFDNRFSNHIRFGGGAQWTKIRSCFSWIELTEIIGFFPRANNITWKSETFKQAAWWIKNNESQERIHGLMVRIGDVKLFDPAEDSIAPYFRWLTRSDVAQMKFEFALRTCSEALDLALKELHLPQEENRSANNRFIFHLERYSRLVLRETRADHLHKYVGQMLLLYSDPRIHKQPALWNNFGNAFSRTLESLPTAVLEGYLPQLSALYLLPAATGRSHDDNYWPEWSQVLWKKEITLLPSIVHAARASAVVLATKLMAKDEPDRFEERRRIRNVLFAYLKLNFLDKKTKFFIGSAIWSPLEKSETNLVMEWNDYLSWPAPAGMKPKQKYKNWLFKQKIPQITESKIDKNGEQQIAVSMLNDEPFLRQWGNTPLKNWTLSEYKKLSDITRSWWESEGNLLITKAKQRQDTNPFYGNDFLWRFDWIERIYADQIIPKLKQLSVSDNSLNTWIQNFVTSIESVGKHAWHIRLALWEVSGTPDSSLTQELLNSLFGVDKDKKKIAINFISKWAVKDSNSCPDILIDALAMVIALHDFAVLLDAIKGWRDIARRRPDVLNDNRRITLEAGLQSLFVKLDYKSINSKFEFEDYARPLVRLECTKLAMAITGSSPPSPSCEKWINNIINDPLPEIRALSDH